MPVLLQSDNTLYLGIGNKIITVNLNNGDSECHDLPPINLPENRSKAQEDLFQEVPIITTISASKNGALLVVSTHNRQVVTYNTKNLLPLSNFIITRAASKICFDNSNNIIVADKTGDAYLYKQDQEPSLLLGHLSMLLDIQMSPCGKFVITSDRDEKIRVSHYPNCYNILCYCLGHQEFVTNVSIVNDQLLSASGDGSICLWDYKTGNKILHIDSNKLLSDKSVETFKYVMDKDNIEVNAIPLTDMQVHEYKSGFALIAITLFQWNNVEVYEFDFKAQTISHVQKINVKDGATIVAISLGAQLSILTNDDLIVYNYVESENKFAVSALGNVIKKYEDITVKYLTKSDVSLLYKRKFDNVQDYLDRKKQRLDGK